MYSIQKNFNNSQKIHMNGDDFKEFVDATANFITNYLENIRER